MSSIRSGGRRCSDPYDYTKLDTTKQQIRLVRLLPPTVVGAAAPENDVVRLQLEVHDITTAPEYIALSYAWGDPSDTRNILVDNRLLTVRTNLFDFLYSFRSQKSNIHYLWIDQLCINQKDTWERNHQVRLMAQIYRSCVFAIAWLGVSSTRAAARFLRNPMAKYVEELCHNVYFTRLWIVQEVLLPRNIRLFCGHIWVEWDSLLKAALRADFFHHDTLWSVVDLLSNRYMHDRDPPVASNSRLLHSVLSSFSGMECQDPRDKVYGLLGLVSEEERPEVDYGKQVEEVYLDTVRMARLFYNEDSTCLRRDLPNNLGFSSAHIAQLDLFYTDMFKATIGSARNGWPGDLNWYMENMGFEKADRRGSHPDRWWYRHNGKRHYHDCLPSAGRKASTLGYTAPVTRSGDRSVTPRYMLRKRLHPGR